MARGDRAHVPSVKAVTSCERRSGEAAEVVEGGEAVRVIESVQRREAWTRAQRCRAVLENDDVGVAVPQPDALARGNDVR